MNNAIAARLDDLIAVAGRLKTTIENEKPGALLPTFVMMRMAVDVDEMANVLSGHAERLASTKGAMKP